MVEGVMNATLVEMISAMQHLDYEENRLNIAIAGCSGVGKSSFINALFGWRNNDPQAAGNDYIETTRKIKKFNGRIAGVDEACFELPAAGTINFSRYEYFKNQGLYIMDAFIIVYSDRLTDTDIHLMMHCIDLNLPFFLVRTKCDTDFDGDRIAIDPDREVFETDEMRVRCEVKKAALRQRTLAEACHYILAAYQKMQKTPPLDVTRYVYLVNRKSLYKFSTQGISDVYAIDEERLLRE